MNVPAQQTPSPLVTVIIPTCGRPLEVRRAIATVQGQTIANWELIVVDDGSQPALDVSDVADPRVHVLRHAECRGVSAARNAGIAHASGHWIAFLDDDDLWAPNKLALQLAAGEKHRADFVYTSIVLASSRGRLQARHDAPDPSADHLGNALKSHNVIWGPSSVLVNSDAVRARGGFDEDLSILADWDMWLRLAATSRAAAVGEPVTAVIRHPASMQVCREREIDAEIALIGLRHGGVLDDAGRPSAATRMWSSSKRWDARRTPAALADYATATLRRYGVLGTASRLLQRGTVAWERPPPWLSCQLREPVPVPVPETVSEHVEVQDSALTA